MRTWRTSARRCGSEDVYHEPAGRRVRLDPLDPKTSRHMGECEFASSTDPSVLRVLLKSSPGWAKATTEWSAAPAAAAGRFRTSLRRERQVMRLGGIRMRSVGR